MTGPHLNSLGFAKPPAETRVVVAMSGGDESGGVGADLASLVQEVGGEDLELHESAARGPKADAASDKLERR